jgi:two-component system, LytTR family, response regulator
MTNDIPLRAILVDDERLARRSLRALLAEHPEIEIVGEAASVRQAESAIAAEHPDVVFLDIQMPGGSGFDLLRKLNDPPAIVFVTAYDKYAIRAFEVNAVDYLLKPVDPRRLASAVARLRNGEGHVSTHAGPYAASDQVMIKTNRRTFFLPVAQISAIWVANNYTYVICAKGEEHLVRRSLKEWVATLPAEYFVALDRSTLIGWQHVERWESHGRKIHLYMGRSAKPLELGRSATHRFKTQVVPLIERRG